MDELLDQKQKLLQRAAELRMKIGGRKMPRIPEPERKKGHWDIVLDEMKWLSAEVIGEKRHKQARAFMLVKEVAERLETIARKRREADAKKREISRLMADSVQGYFTSVQETMKLAIKQFIRTTEWVPEAVPPAEQGHFLYFSKVIHLEEVPAPQVEPKRPEKPIDAYAKRLIEEFGYGNDPMLEVHDASSRSQSPEGHQDNMSTASESIVSEFQNQLYYEVEDYSMWEQEMKLRFDTLTIDDIEVYGPPRFEDDNAFINMLALDDSNDQKLFELLPNAEELSLWETAKKVHHDWENSGSIIRIITASVDFAAQEGMKKDWKVYEDMELEKLVLEFGGLWFFIADLMQASGVTGCDFFTPKHCKRRWRYLQKLKGRLLSEDYVPQPVLCEKQQRVQQIPSRFSLKPLSAQIRVTPAVSTTSTNVSTEFPFQFLLSNISSEENLYLYHYKALNEAHYPHRHHMTSRLGFTPKLVLDVRRLLKEQETEDKEEISNITFSVLSAKASVRDKNIHNLKLVPKPTKQVPITSTLNRGAAGVSIAPRFAQSNDPRMVHQARSRLGSDTSTVASRQSRRPDDPQAFEAPAVPNESS